MLLLGFGDGALKLGEGSEYLTGLRHLQDVPEKDALRRFKLEVDPDSILGAIS